MGIFKNIFNRTKRQMNGSHGRMACRDRFFDIAERIQSRSPCIVDGGANFGGMMNKFLEQYPHALIHAFEPIPKLAKDLMERYAHNSSVKIYDEALGAENKKIQFNVLANLVSSSVLTPSKICRNYHGSAIDVTECVEVTQVRLDTVINEDIDILKLDLQGFELEALKGSQSILGRIKIITLEVEFVPLYEKQPLFADIDLFLRGNGFSLLNLYELWTHPDGQLTSGDAVYLNDHYF